MAAQGQSTSGGGRNRRGGPEAGAAWGPEKEREASEAGVAKGKERA